MTRLVWTLPDGQQTARWAEDAGGGPGGSQDLASVLAVGGDPDGNPITGDVLIDTGGTPGANTFTASTDFNGDGLGIYVADVAGETRIQMSGKLILLADDQFATMVEIGTASIGFFSHAPVAQPVVPLTLPTVQDVIDALVALGLVSQSD